jgi:hypothetical protein
VIADAAKLGPFTQMTVLAALIPDSIQCGEVVANAQSALKRRSSLVTCMKPALMRVWVSRTSRTWRLVRVAREFSCTERPAILDQPTGWAVASEGIRHRATTRG